MNTKLATSLIDMIYHQDNSFKESSTEERLTNRQQTVAPLVDAYFAWVKQTRVKYAVARSSELLF